LAEIACGDWAGLNARAGRPFSHAARCGACASPHPP